MSRFEKASHVLWHCQYHIVWTPKCRFRILKNNAGKEGYRQIRVLSSQLHIGIVELNVQLDHVHLLVKIPPKLSVLEVMGHLKGRTAIRLFNKFPYLRRYKLWGNHFWAKGYCVDTVGVNAEMIPKYVKYQEKHEQEENQLSLNGMWSEDPTGWSLVRPYGARKQYRLLRRRIQSLPVQGVFLV